MILIDGQIRRCGFPSTKLEARTMAPALSSSVRACCTLFSGMPSVLLM
jgi:hypothetical protein